MELKFDFFLNRILTKLDESRYHIFIVSDGSHYIMKSKPFGALMGVLALVAILGVAPAFGQQSAEVDMTKGASSGATADCVAAKNCFNPNPITVAPGTEVEWKNTDTAGHTVTSGQPTDNQTGTVFDSGIVKAGSEFKFTFQNEGTYNYFCMVHPWMTGQVIVSASATPSPPSGIPLGPPYTAPTMLQAMSSDKSEMVNLVVSPPTNGQPLTISLNFTDASGNNIKHQNYAITVTQDGNSIVNNSTGHTHTGLDTQTTPSLTSSDPVDITVTLNGIGLPTADPSTWTGPKGDMVSFPHVVPEFGPIAPIVLAIAVISIVVFTAKSRGIPKL